MITNVCCRLFYLYICLNRS